MFWQLRQVASFFYKNTHVRGCIGRFIEISVYLSQLTKATTKKHRHGQQKHHATGAPTTCRTYRKIASSNNPLTPQTSSSTSPEGPNVQPKSYRCPNPKCSNTVTLYINGKAHCVRCGRPMVKSQEAKPESAAA
jgi:hypothetical protein